jgi:uncharacterized protein (DUF305 family)
MPAKLVALVAVLSTVLALAGCGDGEEEPARATHTASNGDEFNDADVAFATAMVPHHAEALSMVDLTLGRPLDPPVQRLAEDIRASQAPEIEQMVDWLTAWGEEVPATMRDHANAHGEGGMGMEGMSELEHASDAAFQDLFLELMIEHHEGAITIARTEQDEGVFPAAIGMAESIEASQREEIAVMDGLLAD